MSHATETAVVLMRGRETGAGYDLLRFTTPPGDGPPLHIHHEHDEAVYIVEGELTVAVAGERHRLTPGMYAFEPRGVPHAYKNTGDQPCRYLLLLAPAGHVGFFEDVGDLDLPTDRPPDVDRVAPILQRHRIEIVGPPLDG